MHNTTGDVALHGSHKVSTGSPSCKFVVGVFTFKIRFIDFVWE